MKIQLKKYLTACPQAWQKFVRETNLTGDQAGEIIVDQTLDHLYNARVDDTENCVIFNNESSYLMWLLRYGSN